jgi:hypothetical protein
VSAALAQRLFALGAVAVLVGAAAVALLDVRDHRGSGPRPVHWYSALAAPYTPPRHTSCGLRATARTLGIEHPGLACGAKLFVALGSTEVLTQVIDRRSEVPGREFDVTPALAARLGLHGTERVRWAFAR